MDATLIQIIEKSVFQAFQITAPHNGIIYQKYANTKFRFIQKWWDYVYLRASELFYIEAEALAKSGNRIASKECFK